MRRAVQGAHEPPRLFTERRWLSRAWGAAAIRAAIPSPAQSDMRAQSDMSGAAELLGAAAQALIRAEQLINRAASELGEPFQTALQATAADCERIRRRLRTQALTSTRKGARHGP
jgi:hypothetical protein